MSRNYKNIIKIRQTAYGNERRKNLAKEVLKDSTPIPQPLEYEDIDKEFEKWVKDDLSVSYENELLPTFFMVSNQRFSEYMQTWQNVDEKKNILMNFKTITRENNPKPGTIIGNTRNIPGNVDFLMKRVQAMDKNGNRYFIDYRVKQPFAVDLVYTVSIFTNKYQLLNVFNQLLNDKFKAIDCYIRPNGHFIPMKLNEISDESTYDIEDRKFYSQSYNITVMAYIMPKDSFSVVEQPFLKIEGFEGDKRIKKTIVDEIICDDDKYNPYEYTDISITTTIPNNKTNSTFHLDCDLKTYKMKLKNVRFMEMYVNGNCIDINNFINNPQLNDDYITEFDIELNFNKNDVIKYSKISRFILADESTVVIYGHDYTNVKEK